MVNIIKIIILAVFNMLPNSPFRSIVDDVIYEMDFLPTLNWYLPFDICSDITLAWLECIVVYYSFVMVKKVAVDIVLNKLISGISVAVPALGKLIGG